MILDRMLLGRRCFLIAAVTGCSISRGLFASAISAAKNVTATAARWMHPILIRNDYNPVVHVLVQAQQPGVRVTSLVFSLADTDDLKDLETLQLFYAGDELPRELSQVLDTTPFSLEKRAASIEKVGDERDVADESTVPFGQPSKPAVEVTFRGNQVLQEGRNVFWLACKLSSSANLSHKVNARCAAIKTTIGIVTPRDTRGRISSRIGVAVRRHNDDGVHTYRIPALATTPKGTLLCVYDVRRRKRRDLQEDIDIGLSRSTDGGSSWEPMRVIMDMGEYGGLPQEQNGCSDPGIVVDQNTGEIFCAAVWMWGKPGKHQWSGDGSEPGHKIGKSAQFMMVRSGDDGRSWTKPENMTRRLKKAEWILFAPSPQQGITLRDGTLVMPSQGRTADNRYFSTILVSHDHGATWTVGSTSAVGNTECQAVELGDGSIMLNARTEVKSGGRRFRSVYVTDDLGRNWKQHPTHRKTLIEPGCNGSLLRFEYHEAGKNKHVLLFANPHSQMHRENYSIQISFDEGRTWPKEYRLLLDEGRGMGYPSLTRVDDRHVGIVYEGSQAHLVFERLPLSELLKL